MDEVHHGCWLGIVASVGPDAAGDVRIRDMRATGDWPGGGLATSKVAAEVFAWAKLACPMKQLVELSSG